LRRPAVEQAGGTEDERAGADRGDTKRIEAAQEGEHSGIPHLRSPAGAAADNRHIAGRRIGDPYSATTVRPHRGRPDRRDARS
jgi:hypothetical protein